MPVSPLIPATRGLCPKCNLQNKSDWAEGLNAFFLSLPEGGLDLVTFLHKAIVIIYSQVVRQPPGIRRFWFGGSLLSPLRLILRNGDLLLKFLGNALTGERILQRTTPCHLWATGRSRMRYPTCQQLPWCPSTAFYRGILWFNKMAPLSQDVALYHL